MIPKATALIVASTIILVSLSSGCISAYWSKDVINPDEGEYVMKWVEKDVMKHKFVTEFNDPESVRKHMQNITTIVKDTEIMNIHVEVRIDEIVLPVEWPLPEPDRYVEITVTRPDGVDWVNVRYNETGNDTITVLYPMEGDWVITIDAVGYGSDLISYNDFFKVIVKAYEPVPKK